MTSEKRSWYEGATYHITARGHHRNDIFRDEEDFKIYLIILEEALLEQESDFVPLKYPRGF